MPLPPPFLRVYIQPQWIYDCINFRRILPTDKYALGSSLPPHLSPFTRDGEGDYVPPDKLILAEDRIEEEEVEEEREEEEEEEEQEETGNNDEEEDLEPIRPPSPKRRKATVSVFGLRLSSPPLFRPHPLI